MLESIRAYLYSCDIQVVTMGEANGRRPKAGNGVAYYSYCCKASIKQIVFLTSLQRWEALPTTSIEQIVFLTSLQRWEALPTTSIEQIVFLVLQESVWVLILRNIGI